MDDNNTVWTMFECGAGSRWTSSKGPLFENAEGQICNFSGCNCGTIVKRITETTDRTTAHNWFRRPKTKTPT